MKIVELGISIKNIELVFLMEITNSTIFIKMLQKLRENPHFKIVELILCAFFAYSVA